LRDEVARLLLADERAESEGFLREPIWVAHGSPLFLPDFKNGDSEFSGIE